MPFPKNEYLLGIVQSFKPDDRNVAMSMLERKECDGEEYGFDMVHQSRGITQFRNPSSVAGIIRTRSKDRVTAELHSLKDKKALNKRLIRLENAAGKLSAAKFKKLLIEEMADLNSIHERTFEAITWPMLLTGVLSVVNEGDLSTYDFELENKADALAGWDVPADSDPLSDLLAAKDAIRESWGEEPTEILLTTRAFHLAMQSAKLLSTLSNEDKGRYTGTGRLNKLADMTIKLVDTGYTPDGGSFIPYMSSNGTDRDMVMIKAPGPVGVFVEGMPIDANAPDELRGRFAKIFSENDPAIPHILQEWFAIPGFTMPNKTFALKIF